MPVFPLNSLLSVSQHYRHGGKRYTLTHGPSPEVASSEARDRHTVARKALERGENPVLVKQRGRQDALAAAGNTFKAWFEGKSKARSAAWADNVRRWLDRDVYPAIGARIVREKRPADILAVMQTMQADGMAKSGEYRRPLARSAYNGVCYSTGILEMAETERVICASKALVDSGLGVHYVANHEGTTESAFVVRFEGQVHAYVNRCPHGETYLHSNIGQFFDSQGLLFRCPVHGATFLPDSGKCVSGPCVGSSLISLRVEERDGKVIAKDSAHADSRRTPGSPARRAGARSKRK